MEQIASNFPNKFKSKMCQLGCDNEIEDRSHIVKCKMNDDIIDDIDEDVFQSGDNVRMARAAEKFLEIIDKRSMKVKRIEEEKELLGKSSTPHNNAFST